jgi:hypothetical protein
MPGIVYGHPYRPIEESLASNLIINGYSRNKGIGTSFFYTHSTAHILFLLYNRIYSLSLLDLSAFFLLVGFLKESHSFRFLAVHPRPSRLSFLHIFCAATVLRRYYWKDTYDG